MFEFITSLFKKEKTYTKDQVFAIISAVLNGTYDRGIVDEAILEIDRFNAGAVDDPLREHVFSVLSKMRDADTTMDRIKRMQYQQALDSGEM